MRIHLCAGMLWCIMQQNRKSFRHGNTAIIVFGQQFLKLPQIGSGWLVGLYGKNLIGIGIFPSKIQERLHIDRHLHILFQLLSVPGGQRMDVLMHLLLKLYGLRNKLTDHIKNMQLTGFKTM